MLGEDHGQADVMDQRGNRGKNVLGCRGIEGAGRFVEDKDARLGSQNGGDGHPLLLTAREAQQGPAAQIGNPHEVQGFLDPLAHHGRRNAQLLHAVGDLVLDGVGNKPGNRVLSDCTDDIGQFAGAVCAGVALGNRHGAIEAPAAEVWDDPVEGSQQR